VKGDDYKPGRVISLSVDHGLQSASNTMAEVAAATASRLGIEHTGTRIPWSKHPFPDVPKSGIESIARLARYHVLLDNLRTQDTHVLALGHHADDQQETALMRFDRNGKTSMADIAAMRPIRRWGMGVGVEGELGFSGVYGINRWLIRPLLGVRKVRTCTRLSLLPTLKFPNRTASLLHVKPMGWTISRTKRTSNPT
jgi:tRNA(Ile)-lysidine synthase